MKFLEASQTYLSTAVELICGLHKSGYWWLIPLMIILFPLSLLFIIAQTVPVVAPFVYTLF